MFVQQRRGRAQGVRRLPGSRDESAPVDDDTIYHWASITKTFTGIAIMQLRDRGLLSLDDPAVKYVPELREVHNPYGDISQVTIRHLMTHSAGFRAGTWPWGGDQPWHPFEPTRWAQVVAMMPYTELQFRPGTKYSYSNPGVIFLGRIIELFSGDDYEVYINKNIFMPLGHDAQLLRSRAVSPAAAPIAQLRAGTTTACSEQRFDFDTGITVSNGGLNAPLGDMAKYLAFLIGGNDTILKRSSLDEMCDAADSRRRRRRRERQTTCRPGCRASSSGTAASSWSGTAAIRTASSRICISIGRRDPATSSRSTPTSRRSATRGTRRAPSTTTCAMRSRASSGRRRNDHDADARELQAADRRQQSRLEVSRTRRRRTGV